MQYMSNDIPVKINPVVGVDIGGSHITAALVDSTTGSLLRDSLVRLPVNPHADALTILHTWRTVIQQAAGELKGAPLEVGIAMPGPFDYENGISYIKGFNKYESLYGMNVKEWLAKSLNIQPASIRLKNDAAAFLLGEAAFGAAKGYHNAAGLTLGTGLGSARLQGQEAEVCEVNVSPLHEGRAEDYISIRWFLHRYQSLTGHTAPHVQYIADRIKNDTAAAQVFSEFAANLATVLQQFIAAQQPDIIVLGGGIANAFDQFFPAVQQQLNTRIPVRRSMLGEAAAMAGAACGLLPPVPENTIPQTQQNQPTHL